MEDYWVQQVHSRHLGRARLSLLRVSYDFEILAAAQPCVSEARFWCEAPFPHQYGGSACPRVWSSCPNPAARAAFV
eukprot:4662996-Amphidinium_carterae.1